MDFVTLLFKMLLALGLGGLIGIDRERIHRGYPAGIRTLAFISLLGMLSSLIATATLNDYVIPVAIATVFLLIAAGYGMTIYSRKKGFGLTSTIVLLLTFLIGLISFFDDYLYMAISISIITTLILTEKEILHKFARRLKTSELLDALKFGIVAFIILPLLPNQTVDPWNVINPYQLWLMVVLILGISFVGYVAAKIVGSRKGIYWSGLLGGLVSSTAVTTSLSNRCKNDKPLVDACAVGITLASSIMFIRIVLEAYIVNVTLGTMLLVPLISAGIVGAIIPFILKAKKVKETKTELVEKSPFNFIPAIKFTVLLAIILFVSNIIITTLGEQGMYITSIFAGLFDTDAITLSIASLAGTTINYAVAINSILIAAVTNMVVKLILTRILGRKELFNKILLNYTIMTSVLILFTLLNL